MSLRIGIDLGGTKIEIIALDTTGQILLRERVPTPSDGYTATVQAVVNLVRYVERRLNAQGTLGVAVPGPISPATGFIKNANFTGLKGTVGIAVPGAISPATGLIKNANSTCLIGQPLDHDLSLALQRPIRMSNDANCFALSEAVDGAAAGAEVVFGVIIGTGTGGGIVVRQQVLTGPNAIAGEWGHNPLPWPQLTELPGPSCYCGKQGCIETFLSGRGLALDYYNATGQVLTAPTIATHAAQGDSQAEACLSRYADRLARGLASIINVLDPNIIVLGGGLSNLTYLYTEVPRLWGRYVFSDRVDTLLKPARHGDSSGVRGAAWLWPLTN